MARHRNPEAEPAPKPAATKARAGRVRADLRAGRTRAGAHAREGASAHPGGPGARRRSSGGQGRDLVGAQAALRLRGEPMPFVSRGGIKLAHALVTFSLDVKDLVAVDVGASTGGFTDCLLQRGARRVYCIDVGHGQLDWKLVSDARVVVIDRTNIRLMPPERIPSAAGSRWSTSPSSLCAWCCPCCPPWLSPGAPVVALVKPQFEVGRAKVGKGGIVRDEVDRLLALDEIKAAARELGYEVLGETTSPITGGKGNVEYLIHLRH